MKTISLAVLLALQAATPIFRFETDGFWLNLHHFLYVLGRVEAGMPDVKREAVAGAPADEAEGLRTLTGAERAAWREAVAAYAAGFSKRDLVFDREAYTTTNALRRAGDGDRPSDLPIDRSVAAALEKAAPLYRRAWWIRHRDANRAWHRDLQEPLEKFGPQILAYVSRAYQEPWMAGGFPVNVSAWSNWAGAYSTAGSLLVVAAMNAGNRGLHGFEIVFHEAMHQWDEEIDARLMAIAKANGLPFDDLLSHAMIFYTTGEAMKTVVPAHVPYAEVAGIWKGRMGAFKPALDAHWKPYLSGHTPLDGALLALLKRGRDQF
jgi:hypothetical protein